MKQLRPLFEWAALIVGIVGYIQVYSESGPRRSPLYEMNDFVYSTDITSNYYQELKQAGLVPSFDILASPLDFCPDMYPTARASYRGALLAADCYLSKNKPQQALDYLDSAIQLDGTQVEAWYYRGLLYLSLNQYTQGQSSLRQALDATSDAVWRSRIKRELFFSTMNGWAPLPFAVGTIFIAGLEIAKHLGLEISSKKWLAMFIGISVMWAVSFAFMTFY
jgi:tetratricopeptide (TPR) repeat protein